MYHKSCHVVRVGVDQEVGGWICQKKKNPKHGHGGSHTSAAIEIRRKHRRGPGWPPDGGWTVEGGVLNSGDPHAAMPLADRDLGVCQTEDEEPPPLIAVASAVGAVAE